MPVISAPDIVVGIAATLAALTEATAFAVSITRPPPSATKRGERAEPSSDAAASGTPPEATSWTASAAAANSAAAARAARRRQQLKPGETMLSEKLRAPGRHPRGERRPCGPRHAR